MDTFTQENNLQTGILRLILCCTRVIAINVIYHCLKKALSNERVDTKLKTNVLDSDETVCNQRTNGPVNAHLIYWTSKEQNIQNLENIW